MTSLITCLMNSLMTSLTTSGCPFGAGAVRCRTPGVCLACTCSPRRGVLPSPQVLFGAALQACASGGPAFTGRALDLFTALESDSSLNRSNLVVFNAILDAVRR